MFSTMSVYTLIHVVLSLIGILAGLIVLAALLAGRFESPWRGLFVWTTVATTLTGFGFAAGVTPAFITGMVSTAILALLLVALYVKKLTGGWKRVYVVTAIASVYLNVFVLIVQLFLKVPALHALAPQGSEPPFAVMQGIALLAFVLAGYAALKRSRIVPA